ncbi:MAG: alpha/beta hydrolase, partial [Acidobacteriia bacterium]|nr:alpha/beta hydrolase [Terriglobia bacterium]
DVAATRQMMRRAAALAGPAPRLAHVEDLAITGSLMARQYWPARAEGLPLTVYFHGGRFFSGDLESHDPVCRLLALSAGCRVLAAAYRPAPGHLFPAAVEDAAAAVDWALHQRVPVAVAGDSAGANLAAGAALARRGAALRCQLLIYPMIDAACGSPSYAAFAEGYGPGAADMRRGWAEYLPPGTDRRHPRASPLYAEDLRGAAPAFVLTAEYDALRDEGEAYALRLLESGSMVQCRRYPGAIHGFFGMPAILRLAREAMADAAAFLRRHLVEQA